MKKVVILEPCKSCKDLEVMLNTWVKNKNVINIDVKNYIVPYRDEVFSDLYSIYWYAVITYEEQE